MTDMRLSATSVERGFVAHGNGNRIKVVQQVVDVFSNCLLAFREAFQQCIPNQRQPVAVPLVERFANLKLIPAPRQAVYPAQCLLDCLVFVVIPCHDYARSLSFALTVPSVFPAKWLIGLCLLPYLLTWKVYSELVRTRRKPTGPPWINEVHHCPQLVPIGLITPSYLNSTSISTIQLFSETSSSCRWYML